MKATQCHYRDYNYFSNEVSMFDVENTIIKMNSENNDLRFDCFKAALNESIQKYAPTKKQYV